mgnify:CR=1 FL=1
MHLHKPDLVAKALAILDDYGVADLTMRRLARELSVSPGALYWHFANKQELLGAVADEVLAPLTALHVGADWRSRIVTTCAALRDALLSHTDGAELVSASFATGRSAVMTRLVTELAGAAGDAGLPGDHAGLAARTVIYYVLGFTADEQSRLQWDAAGAEIAEEQSPLIDDPGARFAFGLQLLVDGIGAHRLSEMPAAAASRPV